MNAQKCSNLALHLTCTFLAALFGLPSMLNAQAPSLVDPNLRVRTVIENLDQPTTMAFLGANDFLVLEIHDWKIVLPTTSTSSTSPRVKACYWD